MKRGAKDHTSACLHVKSTWFNCDFNQRKSLLFDICILHFGEIEHFEADGLRNIVYSKGKNHTAFFSPLFWFELVLFYPSKDLIMKNVISLVFLFF